jgi:hypothetical protein
MTPAKEMKTMLPSLKNLLPAVLLLTATGALADSPLPAAEMPAKEIVTRTSSDAQKPDEQLRTLTRTVESLAAEVQQLRAEEAERAGHQNAFLDQTSHPMWP